MSRPIETIQYNPKTVIDGISPGSALTANPPNYTTSIHANGGSWSVQTSPFSGNCLKFTAGGLVTIGGAWYSGLNIQDCDFTCRVDLNSSSQIGLTICGDGTGSNGFANFGYWYQVLTNGTVATNILTSGVGSAIGGGGFTPSNYQDMSIRFMRLQGNLVTAVDNASSSIGAMYNTVYPSGEVGLYCFTSAGHTASFDNILVQKPGLMCANFGNSITQGNHTASNNGWRPGFLDYANSGTNNYGWYLVGQSAYGTTLTPFTDGVTGMTSAQIATQISNKISGTLINPGPNTPVLIVMASYNDLNLSQPTSGTQANFKTMIQNVRAWTSTAPIFVFDNYQPLLDAHDYSPYGNAARSGVAAANDNNTYFCDMSAISPKIPVQSIGPGGTPSSNLYLPSDPDGHYILGQYIAQAMDRELLGHKNQVIINF